MDISNNYDSQYDKKILDSDDSSSAYTFVDDISENDINENDIIDDNSYTLVTKNVCKKISELFEIPENKYDNTFVWEPPYEPGLSNCERIIPSYYIQKTNKILEIDYYEMIKDDIRNFRKLNQYQLDYIENLSHKYKNELIHIFNDCLKSIDCLLEK
jgi:hypothetical protein